MSAAETGPDEMAAGTRGGNRWSVARYGTTVVVTADDNGDESDDIECATVADAQRHYADLVDAWTVGDTAPYVDTHEMD